MVINPDGSSPTTVVPGAVSRSECGYGLTWSPDGNRLAYVSGAGLWVVDATGSNNHKVADICGTALSWSPTGEWLAIEAYYSEQRVGLVHPDGTGFRWLVDDTKGPLFNAHEFSPSFSPDGKTIAMITGVVDTVENPWYGWGVFGINVADGQVVTRYVGTNDRTAGGIAASLDCGGTARRYWSNSRISAVLRAASAARDGLTRTSGPCRRWRTVRSLG
jgi:Tol biopolymer transport system component